MVFLKQIPLFKTEYYYGESLDDLDRMPTTTKPGQNMYPNACAPIGTLAMILDEDDLKFYQLRTTGYVEIPYSVFINGGGASTVVDINNLSSAQLAELLKIVEGNTII